MINAPYNFDFFKDLVNVDLFSGAGAINIAFSMKLNFWPWTSVQCMHDASCSYNVIWACWAKTTKSSSRFNLSFLLPCTCYTYSAAQYLSFGLDQTSFCKAAFWRDVIGCRWRSFDAARPLNPFESHNEIHCKNRPDHHDVIQTFLILASIQNRSLSF